METKMESTITELITEKGKIYEVLEHSIKHQASEITTIKHVVTEEAVNLLAETIDEIDPALFKNGLIPVRKIAEILVRKYGLTKYITETGQFDNSAWYGQRTDYFRQFYYPMKILQFNKEAEFPNHIGVRKLPLLDERIKTLKNKQNSGS